MRVHNMESFWAGPPGTFIWTDIADVRAMLLQVPDPFSGKGKSHIRLYMHHAPDNWAEPGNVCGWDGDEDYPTLNPSVHAKQGNYTVWHGFIVKGEISGKRDEEWNACCEK